MNSPGIRPSSEPDASTRVLLDDPSVSGESNQLVLMVPAAALIALTLLG